MNGNGSSFQERDKLLTVEELAGLLQVPPSWVYSQTRKRSANRIPGFRLGKYWRFRESDVMSWLEQGQYARFPVVTNKLLEVERGLWTV